MKVAVISGVTGQDGSYLAELLLSKGYFVIGFSRRVSVNTSERIKHLLTNGNFQFEEGDVCDPLYITTLLTKYRVAEFYNLAAQSHVHTSFTQPVVTTEIDYMGPLNILNCIKNCSPETRFYQASTSEMFGDVFEESDDGAYQDEETYMNPQSPYAIAKLAAHHAVRLYRESYGIFGCSGILFNHESPRRGENFVTRKITKWIGDFLRTIKDADPNSISFDQDNILELGQPVFPKLRLGNLDASRDWGHAKDYCINLDVPILTTHGWKFYNDIKVGDQVINFNTQKNKLSTDVVNQKILLDSDGEKIEFTGRGVHLRVTSNHRMFYQKKSKKSKGGWSDWKVCSAEEMHKKFEDLSTRTKYDYRFPHFQDYDKNDIEIHNDDIVYLIGALLTEGCFTHSSKPGRGLNLSISQSFIANENVYTKISKTIDRLGLSYSLKTRNDGVTEWLFHSKSSREILSWFDTNNIHVMPKWCYSLNQRQAMILIEAMMDCDGHWGGMVYTSKRHKLAVDFQSIACLAGYRTTKIRTDKFGISRVCLITKTKKYTYIMNSQKINDGHDQVWCVSTNNGTIVTRDNECISISGNCKAMWMMLQHDTADDYVVSTEETYSVRDFLNTAFYEAGIDNWENLVVVDPKFYRPAEVPYLCGVSQKIRKTLGWSPEVTFEQLAKEMVEADING